MMCVMQSHIVQALSNTGNVIKPTGVINDLRRIAKHFRLGSQEDAHEFLRYTVDEMQKSCLNGYIRCNQLVTATKKFTIHRTSNVLTLSLKRFASFSGGKLSKFSIRRVWLGCRR
ncbi:hypothetical protein AB205_0138600, partial [Aquarana catesbeiana]